MRLINWLKRLGRKKRVQTDVAILSDAAVLELIRYLENCEVDCEEAFRALDQYAELALHKEDAARLMPLVHQHLEMCAGCHDEYEALLNVLAKSAEAN